MDSNFNVSKYDAASNGLVSLSDSYANKIKTYISFKHLDSAQTVYFKAFSSDLRPNTKIYLFEFDSSRR
jgi:hypothetical protein